MADVQAAFPEAATARRRIRFSSIWLAVPAVAFLLIFMLYPMLQIFGLSVSDHGGLTWKFMAKAMSPGLYLRVLGMTFSVSLQVMLWCIVLGYPLAYWLSGLSGRPQRLALFGILLPFWTSALIKNFSWMVLLGHHGIVSNAFTALGLRAPELLYTKATVVFAMVHTMLPLAVVTMLPVIQQIDRRLQPAAQTLGAGSGQSFWLVVFPLSMRGISSAALLIFVASLGFFVTPQLVGGPKQTMIGQLIIMQINQLQNWQLGAALSVVLLISALISIVIFDRIFGISTVAGSDAGNRTGRLRNLGIAITQWMGTIAARLGGHLPESTGRHVLNIFAAVMIFLLLLPIFAFVPMAFSQSSILSFPPQGVSLRWFQQLFTSDVWMTAILRSIVIGLIVAALTVVVGSLAAIALARGNSYASKPVFLLILSPMIIPPIALAVALFNLFAHIGLVATDLGIIIGHAVIALPIVFVVMLTAFKGYDWRLNDVALTLGASKGQSWRKVALPLLKAGLAVGFITGFLQSFEELTVALFIGGGLKTTLPRQMWDSILLQATPEIAAASVIMLGIVLIFFLAMELLQLRRGRTAATQSE